MKVPSSGFEYLTDTVGSLIGGAVDAVTGAVGQVMFDAVFKPVYDAITGFTAWLLTTLATYWMAINVTTLLTHINHDTLIKNQLAD